MKPLLTFLTNKSASFLSFCHTCHVQISEMSLPGSPFTRTLILKHSTIASSPNSRGHDSLSKPGTKSHMNHIGGSLNRHLRKNRSGHLKRNSLSDKKRSSWASSTGAVEIVCDNSERGSEASSYGPQLSWRSSCGGLRKGLTCHPRDIYQQSGFPLPSNNPAPSTTFLPVGRHPYMLSYSPSTYLEAHADRLPYVDDSTAVSPSISELDNSIAYLPNSALFNYQISQNYCNNHHQMYCNQSNLDHNHYHYYPHNGGTSSPQPNSWSQNQHSSPNSTTHSASKASQGSSYPNTGKIVGCRSLVPSPNHSNNPLIKHLLPKDRPDMELNEQENMSQHPRLSHGNGDDHQPVSFDANNSYSNYVNNTKLVVQSVNENDASRRKYDLHVGVARPNDSGFLINSVGEVCNACLIEASDKKLLNYHNFTLNNHLAATNISNLIRDPHDLNMYGSGFRSRHNSYCSHTSRWSYSSHMVEPIQNLRSPTPCLMASPNIEVSSHKSPTLLSIERVNGSGGDALSQNSG